MPRRKTEPVEEMVQLVQDSHATMVAAKENYHRAQDALLNDLRFARQRGETLENLAEALECSKQWIHKWTTHGRDHNKVTQVA